MTHADLYPCRECGRENLYPGPCESCEHTMPRVVCYDCRKPCNGTCPASRGETDAPVNATASAPVPLP